MSGLKFDSRGEYEYYVGTVVPKIGRGEIVKWEAHPCFLLFPAGEYNGVKLRSVQYTADFRLTYADGTVEIVEVKSKFVRRMQRDYPVRRRVFLELIARPAGWKFTEIITADRQGRNQTLAGAGGGGIIMWEKRLTHYDNDGRVYSSRGYEVALAKLAWFEDREQKRKEMPVCGLCQRHQKLETVDGTAFWLEYGEDGRPRLVMDSTARGGGLNVLCAEFCPMCGRFCGKLEAEHEEK